jgi:hypothetical protein
MGQRLDLQQKLVELLGSTHVYFQPPPTVRMSYPCIVYRRYDIRTDFADDRPYKNLTRYQVTVIDQDPDSDIHKKVGALPACVFERFFAAENLNHDVYNLYF